MAINPDVNIFNIWVNYFYPVIIPVISAVIVEAITFITSVRPIFNGVPAAVIQRPDNLISKTAHFLPSNVK